MSNSTVTMSLEVQGDTSTPSQVKIKAFKSNVAYTGEFAIRARICDDGVFTNATNATIAAVSGKGIAVKTHTSGKDIEFKPNIDVQATETLTLTGVVIDGETFTLGGRIYEIDTDGSVTSGNVAVDVSAHATASQGTLTMDTQPTALDSFEIGGRGYTWVASGTANLPGEISVGADLAEAKTNFVAAINGTDGFNTAHPTVSAGAFSGNDSVITALVPGTAGDSITSTENFTAVTNIFDAGTLGTTTAGVDCTAANADGVIITAINADSSAEVTAAQGAGTTVDVTAIVTGTAGNSIASTETMANGAFGGATLSGATADLEGEVWIAVTNATAETVTLRFGPAELGDLAADLSARVQQITHAAP